MTKQELQIEEAIPLNIKGNLLLKRPHLSYILTHIECIKCRYLYPYPFVVQVKVS